VRQRLDPVYRWDRKALRDVPRLFGPGRCDELAAIPGTSSAREGMLLAHLARQSPPGGVFVEIGAFKGKTTAWLVEAAEHHASRPTVVSIDPHQGMGHWHPRSTWEEFQQTVQRFQLQARGLEVLRAKSSDVAPTWRRPISFLWIDGSHEYEDVAGDINGFVPHVLPGGWVVFDDAADAEFPGVPRAIQEQMLPRDDFAYLGLLRHFAIFRRSS
jgi:predicted O-methyltransferase YrrM